MGGFQKIGFLFKVDFPFSRVFLQFKFFKAPTAKTHQGKKIPENVPKW
jgi:hypothetical protein